MKKIILIIILLSTITLNSCNLRSNTVNTYIKSVYENEIKKSRILNIKWDYSSKTIGIDVSLSKNQKNYLLLLDPINHIIKPVFEFSNFAFHDFSPDGTQILVSDYNEIFVMSRLDPSKVQSIGKGEYASWSPDGKLICIFNVENGSSLDTYFLVINIFDQTTNKIQRVLSIPTKDFIASFGFSWSLDSKKIAFSFSNEINKVDSQIRILDIHTKEESGFDFPGINYFPNWNYFENILIFLSEQQVGYSTYYKIILYNLYSNCYSEVYQTEDTISGLSWEPNGYFLAVASLQKIYLIDLEQIFGKELKNIKYICPTNK